MTRLSKTLIWFGALPFLASIVLYHLDVLLNELSGDVLFVLYSATILSFMSGTLWSNNSHKTSNENSRNLIWSNLWALLSYFALIIQWGFNLTVISLIILLLGFVHTLSIEYDGQPGNADRSKDLSQTEYLATRVRITGLVIGFHIAMLLLVTL